MGHQVSLVVPFEIHVPFLRSNHFVRQLVPFPLRHEFRHGIEQAPRRRGDVRREFRPVHAPQQRPQRVVVARLGQSLGLDEIGHVPPAIEESQGPLRPPNEPSAGVPTGTLLFRKNQIDPSFGCGEKIFNSLCTVHDHRVGVHPVHPIAVFLRQQAPRGADLAPTRRSAVVELRGFVKELVAVFGAVALLVGPRHVE